MQARAKLEDQLERATEIKSSLEEDAARRGLPVDGPNYRLVLRLIRYIERKLSA